MAQETQYCSQCSGDLGNAEVRATHMSGTTGGLVCGETGKLGHVITGVAPDPARTDRDRVAAARGEVTVLLKALDDHARLEGVEVEVRGEVGWMDVHALAWAIEQALS